jgi:hypothetical protein
MRAVAFRHVGWNYESHVTIDASFVRPRLRSCWGVPRKRRSSSLEEMIAEMVEADLAWHRERTR